MPGKRKFMPSTTPYSRNFRKFRKTYSKPRSTGLRKEQLPGDGSTYTLEMAVPRSRFSLESQTFKVLQSFNQQGAFTTNATVPTFAAIHFELDFLDQYAAFGAIFDQYRIDEIEVWIQPQISADVSSGSGLLLSVIDLDDSNVLTSVGQATDYASCVQGPAKTGHFRRFIPRLAVSAYGGSFGAFANRSPMWIDVASPNVQHYGVKLAAPASSTPIIYDIMARYSLSFKCVR